MPNIIFSLGMVFPFLKLGQVIPELALWRERITKPPLNASVHKREHDRDRLDGGGPHPI